MSDFFSILRGGKRLLFDGAMGTMLQKRGLAAGQEPEIFCLEHPDILEAIHREYAEAGCDVLTTNTFGGTSCKLPAGVEVFSFNREMAARALAAARAVTGRRIFVAGSVGPSGRFLRPLGDMDFEELVRAFEEQIRGLAAGGADCILAETQFDIAEARAIAVAARRVGRMPLAVSMTYEHGRTLTGSDVEVCVATLANQGVDMIGVNCSAGPREMAEVVQDMLALSPLPVLVQPNAGLPQLADGVTTFPLGPGDFAELTAAFARDGAQAVGGCCGTTPEHMAALHRAMRDLAPVRPRARGAGVVLTSRSHAVRLAADQPLRVIGERINPTGKKLLAGELAAGEFTTALRFADEQHNAGAHVLDVNVGAPMVDEAQCLPELVAALAQQCPLPLSLDSSNMEAVEKALMVYPASALVNSISGDEGRLERLGPLCRDYGAPFILLPLRGRALPVTAAERVAIVEEMLVRMEELNIPRHLAMVDALVLAVSTTPEAGRQCLEFIRYCAHTLELPVVCGLSNISFGLPARDLLNSAFLNLAVGAGLCACIANPILPRMAEAVDAANLILGHDQGAERFVSRYGAWSGGGRSGPGLDGGPGGVPDGGQGAGQGVPDSLEAAVIQGRRQSMAGLVRKALDAGEEPFAIVRERLIPAIMRVGEKYERKEYFLPQLIRSAESMQEAFSLLSPLLAMDSRSGERPVAIMATVEGDIHDIGKNIVNLMLGNHGFEVVDLGKSVSAERIVDEAARRGAGLIGLSALMTTTMVRMRDTVELVRERELNIPVMVGGAVVTGDFALSIGAHFARDAVGAVRLARTLLAMT